VDAAGRAGARRQERAEAREIVVLERFSRTREHVPGPRPLAVCATTAGGPVAGRVPAHPDAPGVGVSRPRGGWWPLGGEATRYAYVRYNSRGSQDRSGHGHTLAAASAALLMRAVHTACTGKHAIDAVR